MSNITIVVAINQDNVIGVDNQLPWHITEDLQHFKKVTLGKPIIMGRKTFESIGRVLPGRPNIVISRNKDFNYPGISRFNSLDEALLEYNRYSELCIIGGGDIFKMALPLANKMHLTIVELPVPNATTFFPSINFNEWKLIKEEKILSVSNIKCTFCEFIRIC